MDGIDKDPVWVGEDALSTTLRQLMGINSDPANGLFGPESMFWEVNRHTLVYFLGAVQSVQMQLCHPWIATAVYEHSKIMTDPRQRARLTYIYLWSLIYGDLDMAMKKAKALYRVHTRVQGEIHQQSGVHAAGSRYAANEVNALLWVHVTAFWCRIKNYEKLVRPLSAEQLDQFVREAQRYALCFGIPLSVQPATWQEVEDYIATMSGSDVLARTEEGLKIRRFLEGSIPAPLRGAIWNFLCMPLPARLQVMMDQPTGTPKNRMRAERMTRTLRIIGRLLPVKLRYVSAWHEARQRLAGKSKPDWMTARINKLILGQEKLVSKGTP